MMEQATHMQYASIRSSTHHTDNQDRVDFNIILGLVWGGWHHADWRNSKQGVSSARFPDYM